MYSAIAANKRNTVFIVGLFIALVAGGALFWGYSTNNLTSALVIIGFAAGDGVELIFHSCGKAIVDQFAEV